MRDPMHIPAVRSQFWPSYSTAVDHRYVPKRPRKASHAFPNYYGSVSHPGLRSLSGVRPGGSRGAWSNRDSGRRPKSAKQPVARLFLITTTRLSNLRSYISPLPQFVRDASPESSTLAPAKLQFRHYGTEWNTR